MRCPKIMLPLLRKWRSHGHGIHSPFAFAFVTTVLRQPCAYYAYSAIDSLALDNSDRSIARRLFRIIISLRPAAIEVSGEFSPACQKAIDLAKGSFTTHASATMYVSKAPHPISLLPDQSAIVTGSGKALTATADTIFAPLTRGMLFSGRKMAVVVALARLPKQKFTVDI